MAPRPNLAEVHSGPGETLRNLGEPGRAMAAMREASRLKPGPDEVRESLGLADLPRGVGGRPVEEHRVEQILNAALPGGFLREIERGR